MRAQQQGSAWSTLSSCVGAVAWLASGTKPCNATYQASYQLSAGWTVQGDAEDLPFATDSFDRYVSAGSIEYWPEPQRGIKEAYRVVQEGGLACLIGPVHPTFWLSRWFADVWMLFPTEAEYMEVRHPSCSCLLSTSTEIYIC